MHLKSLVGASTRLEYIDRYLCQSEMRFMILRRCPRAGGASIGMFRRSAARLIDAGAPSCGRSDGSAGQLFASTVI